MARRTKRLWRDEGKKHSICFQTAAGVSVAQVARRHVMNANLIFKGLREPRHAPGPNAAGDDAPCFLPVKIVDQPMHETSSDAVDPAPAPGVIEIVLAGGHRLRIIGG